MKVAIYYEKHVLLVYSYQPLATAKCLLLNKDFLSGCLQWQNAATLYYS